MQLVHKTTTSEFDAGLNCVLSDLTPDAYSDVVGDAAHPTLGWDTADFKRNPIALWSHDSRSPIGTWRDVAVSDGALRGRLHLAPPGSTKLVDELRALLAANVIRGISVGFKPVESKPRSNGGVHYLRQTLVEASLVAVPANPSALLCAKALGISEETQRMVFKQSDLTIAQRIRRVRRAIQKAKLHQEKASTPASRATWTRTIAAFEREERELCESLSPRPSAAEARARAQEVLDRVEQAQQEAWLRSPSGQKAMAEVEMIEAFTRQSQRHPQDPKPFVPGDAGQPTWRGVKLPGLTWRGRKI